MLDFNFNFKNTTAYKKQIIKFLKSLSNVEIGGDRLYDGMGTIIYKILMKYQI